MIPALGFLSVEPRKEKGIVAVEGFVHLGRGASPGVSPVIPAHR